ncbi:hypothetical protein [Curtobacterium sp. MCSS17_005]|uniref:hypothetical protein n=1 Tax=Curtobacterium sp. MCSS17_005 TaxID=2175641 RepID=UPI000DA86E39|nr:hypothetical protein [Curtobacterium sp. MCSS17_005]WIB34419.1 hypothetical protein DEJ20_08110 [Curtobacterium sp. MCSS17_005]
MLISVPTISPSPTPHIVVDLVDHASSNAPWWGVTVLAGFFLVVGALISFLATRSIDDRKAKRDHVNRWHDEVRKLGTDAIAAAREIHQHSVDQAGFYNVPDPLDQPEADRHIATLQNELDAEYAKLLHTQGGLNLVAPASITKTLGEVVTAAHNVVIANEHQHKTARDDLRPKITTFIEANRKHLGIAD